jgi:phosphate-selective porin OprO and OprP
MKRSNIIRALLAGSALVLSSAAFAQDPAPAEQPAEAQPDQSDATADAAIQQAQDLDDAQAKIELLQAQVEALQESIAQIQAAQAKALPSWKGAPQLEDKDNGWSFKPKGLLQYDAGYVGYPRGDELRGTILGITQAGAQNVSAGLNFGNLGWSTRARRLTIGADGSLPGGFRYSAEFNFAQSQVDFEDVLLAYDFKKAPLTVQIGYFYPFSSLETMTSSKYTSFMERAGITDAFSHNRRIGAALLATDKVSDKWTAQAGIFSEEMNSNDFQRTGWTFAARGVFSPTLGTTRLHLGANFEHRVNKKEAMGRNYQARPMTQITDQRFISTGNLASKGDDILGIEGAAIFKQFHVAAEAQKVWVRDALDQGEINSINADLDSNVIPTGAALNGDPNFWGGYAEVGFYLTGETRAYKGGSFGRVKVLKPFNQGGWGAFQINGRIDYLDLSDRVSDKAVLAATQFTAADGSGLVYVNGGKQTAYQLSLIWNPMDYVRFMAQYSHLNVKGGPRVSVDSVAVPTASNQLGIFPFGTSESILDRDFNSDVFTMRAQIDF